MLSNNPPSNPHWIFTLDWILIDTYIILLLIIFLISVKIFKATHRWRPSYSNTSLQSNKIKTSKAKITILSNTTIEPHFTIISVFSKFKKRLAHIISEGLASYGFKIVLVQISSPAINIMTDLESIKDYGVQDKILLNFSKNVPEPLFSDAAYSILINPATRLENYKTSRQIFAIYSGKKRIFKKNTIVKEDSTQIIAEAKKSFKFYETLLFAKILNVLNKKR